MYYYYIPVLLCCQDLTMQWRQESDKKEESFFVEGTEQVEPLEQGQMSALLFFFPKFSRSLPESLWLFSQCVPSPPYIPSVSCCFLLALLSASLWHRLFIVQQSSSLQFPGNTAGLHFPGSCGVRCGHAYTLHPVGVVEGMSNFLAWPYKNTHLCSSLTFFSLLTGEEQEDSCLPGCLKNCVGGAEWPS